MFLILQLNIKNLDHYRKGKIIPHFVLNLKLKDVRNPQRFVQDLYFTRTQNFIRLSRDPISGLYWFMTVFMVIQVYTNRSYKMKR